MLKFTNEYANYFKMGEWENSVDHIFTLGQHYSDLESWVIFQDKTQSDESSQWKYICTIFIIHSNIYVYMYSQIYTIL